MEIQKNPELRNVNASVSNITYYFISQLAEGMLNIQTTTSAR